MAYTMANAVIGEYPEFQIDPAKVLVSRGTLTPVSDATVSYQDGDIQFQWGGIVGDESSAATDKALIAILNPVKNEAVTVSAGAPRGDCVQNVNIPFEWKGDKVHTYMGFISENGKQVANSVYLGAVDIP